RGIPAVQTAWYGLVRGPAHRPGLVGSPMYYSLNAGNLLYRWTSTPTTVWPDPVKGLGAYFTSKDGGRYNGPDQTTVYCSEDPLVVITDGAYYHSLAWPQLLAKTRLNPLSHPLRREHLLCAFLIDPPPAIQHLLTDLTR